jgi:hypothetical protein
MVSGLKSSVFIRLEFVAGLDQYRSRPDAALAGNAGGEGFLSGSCFGNTHTKVRVMV